ncbi:unnamed protein product [Hermetia illucens]|uniref:non-specific serine/threonine protein kinase n=1 Tax=Hermetia illucens TaxID=343691 RepID=A0A7R8UQY3_HERIL|nr:phosphoinositide 3-kinase regulatory subunit 4 [Hermetia illucens]CAD7085003.1 unnamed protein product [Hermetia illucens]
MGNQLVGIAPSQIYPVEHYFAGTIDHDLQFDLSMGSTRFFKVARAKCDEGLVVVKVFVKHDPTLPLEAHAERLEYIKKTLANAVNCLPFQKVIINDRAVYIMREYVKHSLYDRVSTRPFLTVLEKKWITFQILCALNQCHKQKICHGDIKLENILITSWNWILLSDFASFKPTYLPEDNPADYTYFFDTSRRRTCYIAPERFVKTFTSDNVTQQGDIPVLSDSILPNESFMRDGPYYSGSLLPEMDIFSAGCALLELWTEGTAPFEFSQLLAYHRGDDELVAKHLLGIENEHLRALLSSMLSRNPKERKAAEIYLDQERGRLFPEYFYSFLQSYLQMFSSTEIMTPDDKINRLHSDMLHFIKVLTKQSDEGEIIPTEKKEKETCNAPCDQDGLILIITVVTSCIRGLHHCDTKICSLEILQKFAEYTSSETILDRILPYILHLTKDSSSRVQATALDTLTACLGMVKDIPRSDANVFPEYILPEIAPLATDSSTIVRVSYAKNIAQLAETAVYFLEQTQLNSPNDMPRYEAELHALHEIIQQTVLSLLTDPQPIVKQTLMESGITNLCVFFGKQKANDVILSHMITFLNDKEDKNLRGAFFDCIVGVAAYVGWQSSIILYPLLQQGLTDSEEFVIAKSIRATTSLIESGLIQKPLLIAFITDCACYLNHPNLWIRHEICGLISTAAQTLSTIDVQCKIMPVILNHLKAPIIQVAKIEILMNSLQPPIPRNIFDSIVRFPNVPQFIKYLEKQKEARALASHDQLPLCEDMDTALRNLIRRLTSDGMNELIENQLLSMKNHLIKLSKYKSQEPRKNQTSRIMISKQDVICYEYPLSDKAVKNETNQRKVRKPDQEGTSNLEWQHIYGNMDHSPDTSSPSNDSGSSGTAGSPGTGTLVQPTPTSSSLVEYSLPERSFMQERTSECRKDLEKLRAKLKARYAVVSSNREYNPAKYYSAIPSKWRMNGTLVAHLHEHKASVVKLTSLKPYGPLFASGSADGTVRLWDCNKLNGNHSINKSKQVYSANTPINALAACEGGQSLAVGGKNGELLIMRIDRNSSKMTLQQALHLDGTSMHENGYNDGPVVDMQPLDQNVIVYATLYSGIVAWDLRMQNSAWHLKTKLSNGVITTMCADPTASWLAVATSHGKHICWDLRFRLPITEIKHPHDYWIRKILCHPTEPSYLISSSHGNNEVTIWNVETGQRQQVLWASSPSPLSISNSNSSSATCALLTGVVDGTPFLLTGSSDQRIRYWDLAQPKNSRLVVPSNKESLADVSFTYDSRLIDGIPVVCETITSLGTSGSMGSSRSADEQPRSGPEMPSPYFIDSITDLIMCNTDKQQTFIPSAGRDGVIKIWK